MCLIMDTELAQAANFTPGVLVMGEEKWNALQVIHQTGSQESGVLMSLCGPLASAGVNLLSVTATDSAYLFVDSTQLTRASDVLDSNGFQLTVLCPATRARA